MTITKILEQTLSAGATSVTFTDADIPNSLIRVFSSNPDIIPVSRTLINNSLTVSYAPQSSAMDVAVEIVKQGLDIVDDLTSTDTDKALSAKQGYIIKGLIDNIPTVITTLAGLNDVTITSPEAGQFLMFTDNDIWENVTIPDAESEGF